MSPAANSNLEFVSDHSATTDLARETLLAEAGYGCAICGAPIVTFVSSGSGEIVLCPEHSRFLEEGQADQSMAAHPFNLAHSAESGMLLVSSRYPVTRFKGVIVVNDELTISADGEAVLRLRVLGGRLLVSMKLYDAEGVVRAEIVDNEWVNGDSQDVVIEHSSNKLMITFQTGAPILSIDTSRTPLQLTASLAFGGVPISIGSKGISVGDRLASFMDDGYAGCVLDIDTETQSVAVTPDPRHGGHSIIVTERDPFQRIVKALNAMASLRSHIEDDPFSHL
jgi:hypothetical protein